MRTALWPALLVAAAAGCSGGSPGEPTPPGQAPVIQQIQPSSSPVGGTLTIAGSGFASTGNAIHIGGGYVLNQDSTDRRSIRFVLPEYMGVCPPSAQACIALVLQLTPGTYKVSVVSAAGESNEVALQVTQK
jgi:hypothetical protein